MLLGVYQFGFCFYRRPWWFASALAEVLWCCSVLSSLSPLCGVLWWWSTTQSVEDIIGLSSTCWKSLERIIVSERTEYLRQIDFCRATKLDFEREGVLKISCFWFIQRLQTGLTLVLLLIWYFLNFRRHSILLTTLSSSLSCRCLVLRVSFFCRFEIFLLAVQFVSGLQVRLVLHPRAVTSGVL